MTDFTRIVKGGTPSPSLRKSTRTITYRINTEIRNFKRKASTFLRKRDEKHYLWYCISDKFSIKKSDKHKQQSKKHIFFKKIQKRFADTKISTTFASQLRNKAIN